MFPDTGVLAD